MLEAFGLNKIQSVRDWYEQCKSEFQASPDHVGCFKLAPSVFYKADLPAQFQKFDCASLALQLQKRKWDDDDKRGASGNDLQLAVPGTLQAADLVQARYAYAPLRDVVGEDDVFAMPEDDSSLESLEKLVSLELQVQDPSMMNAIFDDDARVRGMPWKIFRVLNS